MVGEQADNGAPLHGDVLEEIISHVASLDLVPSSQVSKSWRSAVTDSLRRSSRRRFPWLISPPLPSSPSQLTPLAQLGAASQLAISTDAFGSTWRHLRGPEVWREDAVVALVGSRLIVAGGTCGFEGNPMTVESCDADVGMWEVCEPLPEAFRGSASATWLSVAAGEQELHVLEKREGLLSSFHAETKRWSRVCQLSTDPAVFLSAIGLVGERLILVGAAGEPTAVESIKVWEVGRDSHDSTEMREIGRMPAEMVGRLVGDGWGLSSSIGFSVIGELGYLYNPSELGEVFVCEFGEGTCRWASAGEPGEQVASHRVVFGCATVDMEQLKGLFGAIRVCGEGVAQYGSI